MLQKNEIIEAKIIDMGSFGEGIAKCDGYTIFVKKAVVGDEAKIKILKANKNFAYGKIEEFIKKSDSRQEPKCPIFGRCGGCDIMNLKYDEQLKLKENIVKNNIYKITSYSENDFEFNKIIPSENEYFYRNKAQIPLAMVNKIPVMGFYVSKTHNIVPFEKMCHIQHENISEIANICFEFIKEQNISIYDEQTHKGILKNIYIRDFADETMVCFVTNSDKKIKNINLLEKMLENFNVTSIIQNINTKKNNVLLGEKNILLLGNDFVFAKLFDLKFKISPQSFFQINTEQTEKLYEKAVEFADITSEDTVLDLFCGVGTITLTMAKKCKNVVGIEITKQAVVNAKENAKINNINNVEFYEGDCFKVIDQLLKSGLKADVVVIDPPRKGATEELLNLIHQISPKKLVYVSCNSSTLARDVEFLKNKGYALKKLTPLDMFPQTRHVECVVGLCRVDKA